MTVVAQLKNYPAIFSSPVSFSLVILDNIAPKIDDQLYMIG